VWDVIGVGANSIDHVYRLPGRPAFDAANTKMRIASRALWCGGQVATALATCAAMGLRAKYIGATGNDDNAARVLRELSARGVDVGHVVTRDCENPYAVILVDEQTGERIVLWDRAEALTLRGDELPADVLTSGRVIHVDDVDQAAAIAAAGIARQAGLPVTSDIDRLTERTEELVRAVTVPILAQHVPVALTGETDVERGLRKLRLRHDGILCVTLGRDGAMMLHGDRLYHASAIAVKAIDTTAAGDIFRGAFIRALLAGFGPPDMLRFANAAAGLGCTRPGAINSVPTLEEVERVVN
jgi:sulfofructose kinase